MTTLVVAAHPDDEVLGCGGVIARLSGEGEEVHIVILGEGVTSRYDQPDAADRAELEELRRQCRHASSLLGARDVTRFDLPDNRFDTVPLLDIVKRVEATIARVQPTVVYTQHGGDLNVDHQLTFRAVLAASRPVPGSVVREVLAYEVGSSTEWSFQRFSPVFRPSVFVDISATLERKVEAMLAYEGETRSFPHPRSAESLRAQAARWGSTAGVAAAEAFELVRMVK